MKKNPNTLTIKPSRAYKMDPDEVQMYLHMKRKGAHVGKDNTQYKRKQKHVKPYHSDM